MANLTFALETADVAAAIGSVKTIVQLVAPTNQRVKLLGWGIAFEGVLTTGQPVAVRLLRQSTAGTMTSLTPVNLNSVAETIQSTAQHTATAEPTPGDILFTGFIHPQQGIVVQFPFGYEIIVAGGGRLGLEVLLASGQAAVDCRASMHCEE